MYIRVRRLNVDKENLIIINVSKSTLIRDVHKIIEKKTGFKSTQQKLYYKGKELRKDYQINDYGLKLNDVVQLLVRDETLLTSPLNSPQKHEQIAKIPAKSQHYSIGDLIDFRDEEHGAWFEAKIIKILATSTQKDKYNEIDLIYTIKLDRGGESAPLEVSCSEIRPRSFYTFEKSELRPKMTVLANYNVEKPKERGYWYDCLIQRVNNTTITATLLIGRSKTHLKNCHVQFIEEIMRIEAFADNRKIQDGGHTTPKRQIPPYCEDCLDAPDVKCTACGCMVCEERDSHGILILCDECDDSYHLACLEPPLLAVPHDEWYCPKCRTRTDEIVRAGEALKPNSRKEKLPAAAKKSSFEWGKGMACVGRLVECTLVPKNHFGPIPGVEVGTCWKFRVQVSEAGVHRPHVAGIHGREKVGAYSLILSGGYEDDVDNGNEFYYTGSGGRDLSGNKRVNEQSSDQKLKRMNMALALNCNSEEWKKGKPVRVVRNYKLAKHSKFAPKAGNRYDGIYKVVKYFPEKGKSGFIVWRYLLRRDDPAPAPWEEGGQELDIIYPPGHLEAELVAEGANTKKRRTQDGVDFKLAKKAKLSAYILPEVTIKLIEKDEINRNVWNECLEKTKNGRTKFLESIESSFMCVCCQDLVLRPVTTTCNHNICKDCLDRFFQLGTKTCPLCRSDLSLESSFCLNGALDEILKTLFPIRGLIN